MRYSFPSMITRVFNTMTFGAFKTNRLGRPVFPEIGEAARRVREIAEYERLHPGGPRPPVDPNVFRTPPDPGAADSRPPDPFPPWSPP